jgi:hypothetical protein
MIQDTVPAAALALALVASAAHAQKVYVDYDGATAFSQLRTFELVETNEDLRDLSTVLHERVFSTIAQYLSEGGMTQVEQDPDVFVAYFTADRGHLRLILGDLDYTYGESFEHGEYWQGGVGTRTPDTFTFEEGTLVIDVWEADTKRLIWRGIATAALGKTNDKNVEKLEKALAKIFEQWEKEYGGSARRLRLHQEAQDDGWR